MLYFLLISLLMHQYVRKKYTAANGQGKANLQNPTVLTYPQHRRHPPQKKKNLWGSWIWQEKNSSYWCFSSMADILFNGFSLIKKLKSISALFPSLRNFRSMNHRPNDPRAAHSVCTMLNSERSAKHRGWQDSSIMFTITTIIIIILFPHVYLMCIKISDSKCLKSWE